MHKYFLLFLCGFHLFADCSNDKITQPKRPDESYNKIPVENENSIINIPLKADKNELQRQLNKQLSGDIYSDMDASDDGMLVKASKREDIEIELHPDEIYYRVPINLWIQKSLAITSAEATGSLDLVFKTSYELYDDWSLKTQTEVTGYEWVEKPILKLGFAKIPIQSISNIVVDKAKTQVATAIDTQVSKNLNLNEQIGKVWLQLHRPMEVSAEPKTWLMTNPASLSLTPIQIDGDTIMTTIQVQAKPQIFIGEPPAVPVANPLPSLIFAEETGDDFHLSLSTEIPFTEAQKIALENLDDYSFTQGGKTVTITDIEIYGQGNKLVVGTQTEGAYNGKIYLKGKPVFSEKKNRIELENIDFDFSSKKFLLSSLSWLFKGKFKSILQENLDFQISQNMNTIKELIETQLKEYKVAEGVTLKGNLQDLAVKKVYLTPDAIRLTVELNGGLRVDVR